MGFIQNEDQSAQKEDLVVARAFVKENVKLPGDFG
jgi:hypothetical protein